MLLCLDIGNSQIFGGLFDDSGALQVKFRRTSQLRSSSDELGVFFRAVLRENDVNPNSITEVAICCVVPDLLYSLRACCQKYFGLEPLVLRPGIKTGLKIKYRESFRPFAPAVLSERVSEWFDLDRASPYMLLVADVAANRQIPMTENEQALFGIEKLNVSRSEIPAVTHVDYSARIQTVHKETNPGFYMLLQEFEQRTECPVLVNTSFNVHIY